jgi:hypothetical protein
MRIGARGQCPILFGLRSARREHGRCRDYRLLRNSHIAHPATAAFILVALTFFWNFGFPNFFSKFQLH